MFVLADFKHLPFTQWRAMGTKQRRLARRGSLLLSGPGRGRSPIKRALRQDLRPAREVRIIAAYFLPPLRLRRALTQVARRGGRVQLILPGKSDVPLMQLAARSLYQRLLRNGVEIYEYEPQILHSKLILIDDILYVGSANLDTRSLNINYELLVRLQDANLAAGAREIFEADLSRSRRIHPVLWRKSRTLWNKLRERWAYLFFAKLDPYVARWQWHRIRTIPP
jgi:cardiolipin synthase